MPPARQVVAPAKAGAQSLPLARTGGKETESLASRLRAGLSEDFAMGKDPKAQ